MQPRRLRSNPLFSHFRQLAGNRAKTGLGGNPGLNALSLCFGDGGFDCRGGWPSTAVQRTREPSAYFVPSVSQTMLGSDRARWRAISAIPAILPIGSRGYPRNNLRYQRSSAVRSWVFRSRRFLPAIFCAPLPAPFIRFSPGCRPFWAVLLQTLDFRPFDPWVTQRFPLGHPRFSTGSPKVFLGSPKACKLSVQQRVVAGPEGLTADC
jgi:hypothetical protein